MIKVIAGVDEAGRGALIGNVVAAAVVLPEAYDTALVADSKSLTEARREICAEYIKSIAVAYAVGFATPKEIDMLNIHHASLLAMKRAIENLSVPIDEVWVDGKFTPEIAQPAIAFIKGDALHDCISAASIIAKTTRDAELRQLHVRYPTFGFDSHKGYPTKQHTLAIEKFGVLPEHRKSYKTIKKAIG